MQTMKKYGVKMREIAPRHRLLLRDAFVPRHAGRVIAACVDAREPVSLYYWLRRLFKTDSAKLYPQALYAFASGAGSRLV